MIFTIKFHPSQTSKNAEEICAASVIVKIEDAKLARIAIVSPKQIPSASKNRAHKAKIVVSFLIVFTLLNYAEMNLL